MHQSLRLLFTQCAKCNPSNTVTLCLPHAQHYKSHTGHGNLSSSVISLVFAPMSYFTGNRTHMEEVLRTKTAVYWYVTPQENYQHYEKLPLTQQSQPRG